MALKIRLAGRVKSKFYCFVKVTCSECNMPHMYRKVGTSDTRFDGRRFKYVCYERKAQ